MLENANKISPLLKVLSLPMTWGRLWGPTAADKTRCSKTFTIRCTCQSLASKSCHPFWWLKLKHAEFCDQLEVVQQASTNFNTCQKFSMHLIHDFVWDLLLCLHVFGLAKICAIETKQLWRGNGCLLVSWINDNFVNLVKMSQNWHISKCSPLVCWQTKCYTIFPPSKKSMYTSARICFQPAGVGFQVASAKIQATRPNLNSV